MGFVFSKVFSSLFGSEQIRLIIIGLDNAGKTTILYRLHKDEVVQTVPTVGFNVESVSYKNLKFQVWDLGGQTSLRPYWRWYYENSNAIIYVVDSTDKDRLDIARQELELMLEEEEVKGLPLLIFANKQDSPDALSESEIVNALDLHSIKNRQWALFKISAIKGEGLNEGFEWLVDVLK